MFLFRVLTQLAYLFMFLAEIFYTAPIVEVMNNIAIMVVLSIEEKSKETSGDFPLSALCWEKDVVIISG